MTDLSGCVFRCLIKSEAIQRALFWYGRCCIWRFFCLGLVLSIIAKGYDKGHSCAHRGVVAAACSHLWLHAPDAFDVIIREGKISSSSDISLMIMRQKRKIVCKESQISSPSWVSSHCVSNLSETRVQVTNSSPHLCWTVKNWTNLPHHDCVSVVGLTVAGNLR